MTPILRIAAVSALFGVAAFNTACEGVVSGDTDGSDLVCINGGTYAEAFQASLSITRLVIDDRGLQTNFNSHTSYDGEPAACFDEASNTAVLVFEVDNADYGRITVGADTEGNMDLAGSDGTLKIDLFGEETPVVFTKSHFTNGSWYVSSTSPSLETDVLGDANNGGRRLSITFAADVTP